MAQSSFLLEQWREQLDAIVREADQITAGLTDSQFNWRPGGDVWSLAQVFDHLNKVGQKMLPLLEAAITPAARRELAGQAPWKPGMFESFFINMLGPNPKRKVPVPKPYLPDPSGELQDVMAEFADVHMRYAHCVEKADGLNLTHIKITSPVSKMVRLSLGGWFAATVVHEQYHIGQARAVRAMAAFPTGEPAGNRGV